MGKIRRARGGARTLDHKVKSLALYRLSYPGTHTGAHSPKDGGATLCTPAGISIDNKGLRIHTYTYT